MKLDEKLFLIAVQQEVGSPYEPYKTKSNTSVRELGEKLGMHHKRVDYICEKWTNKDWYEYGTSVDLGWMTLKGMEQ